MRGRLLAALFAGLLTAPLTADAQPAGKLYRIGVLDSVDAAANADNLGALRHGLAMLGYVEGQSFVFEYRSADGRPERFSDLAVELVQRNVDVIVTRGAPATFAAGRATQSIPIVMASSSHPVFEGLVPNLSRPGGNITGLYATAPIELGGERLRLLKEALPAASRIGVLWNPGDLRAPLVAKDTERVARDLGVRIEHLDLQRADPLETVFESALYRKIDALITVEDAFTVAYRARILEFAATSRLPSMHGLREFVEEGGLMSYGTDRRDLYRRAAGYIHRIFSGASPGDLPVEPAMKFELVINLKTARTLGLTIPPGLLRRADHVIP